MDELVGQTLLNRYCVDAILKSGGIPRVSRIHTVIRIGQGRFFLQDQRGQSGTTVNGRMIPATVLNDGDVIAIGGDVFVFHIGS